MPDETEDWSQYEVKPSAAKKADDWSQYEVKKKPSTSGGSTGSQAGTLPSNPQSSSTESEPDILGALQSAGTGNFLPQQQQPTQPTGQPAGQPTAQPTGQPAMGLNGKPFVLPQQATPAQENQFGINPQAKPLPPPLTPLNVKNVKEAAQTLTDYDTKVKTYKGLQAMQESKSTDPDVAEYLQLVQHLNELKTKGDIQGYNEALPYANELFKKQTQNGRTVEQEVGYMRDMQPKIVAAGTDIQSHQDEMNRIGEALQNKELPDTDKETSYIGGYVKHVLKTHETLFQGIASLEKLLGATPENQKNSWAQKAADYYKEAEHFPDAPKNFGGNLANAAGEATGFLAKVMAMPESIPLHFVTYSAISAASSSLINWNQKMHPKLPQVKKLHKQ